MYVGVILDNRIMNLEWISIPHVCGGDPLPHYIVDTYNGYSPCMWG